MAGIGFQLRRLQKQETISSIVAAAGHAAMIAAGPWLFTIVSLAIITLTADQIAGLEKLASFRAIVIYAFALSLVLSAPIVIVSTRLVGNALWQKAPEQVRGLMIGALVTVLAPVGIGLMLCLAFFRLPGANAVALASMTLIVSFIWIAIAFCGAVRDYRGVTWSFALGLLVATILTIGTAIAGFESAGMACGFAGGLSVTFFGLTSRVFATFPHPVPDPVSHIGAVWSGLSRYRPVAIGALLGTSAIWIDKWIFWLSSLGETVEIGLLHAPRYDSSMFIASLLLIPGLASFITNLETGFFERYQQYYATIGSHGTLGQIEAARARLARYTMESLALITVSLVGLAGIVLLTAPIIIEALGLQFSQIAVLRYGALGAVFQFIFIATSSVLLFFDRRLRYLALQVTYLLLSAGFAWLSIRLGEDFIGTGYFAANLIAALIAYRQTDQTFQNLNFLTFIGNNPSVHEGLMRRR
jgi:polysaccharide biosynthesis protein PelG